MIDSLRRLLMLTLGQRLRAHAKYWVLSVLMLCVVMCRICVRRFVAVTSPFGWRRANTLYVFGLLPFMCLRSECVGGRRDVSTPLPSSSSSSH